MSPQPRRLTSLKWLSPTAPSLSRSSCIASHPMSLALCGLLLLLGFLPKTQTKQTNLKKLFDEGRRANRRETDREINFKEEEEECMSAASGSSFLPQQHMVVYRICCCSRAAICAAASFLIRWSLIIGGGVRDELGGAGVVVLLLRLVARGGYLQHLGGSRTAIRLGALPKGSYSKGSYPEGPCPGRTYPGGFLRGRRNCSFVPEQSSHQLHRTHASTLVLVLLTRRAGLYSFSYVLFQLHGRIQLLFLLQS